MEPHEGESLVDTNDELNKFEVSPGMDYSVVDYVPYSSLVGTLKEICGLSYKDVIEKKMIWLKTQSMANSKTNLYCRFSTYEKDRLANIFWRDSHSLFEYKCFRDVFVFYSTYKTNAYAKPLVLFVGVNNQRETCVFRVALLSDETM
ncbi:hypothetical protein Ddye_011323 [Dipteronia dyeriana]|uniref:Protein FAR1-RELATED SEQUENCE n=1 Tax=Dipteronia dyeriana TaxID=168575 RepID=A0AAD9X2B3_9ROSI|nr:hypothetical protein Ddye_011323 [Dipteronia dyeriana]